MKEGYIIHVVGEEPLHESELQLLIKNSNLDLFACRVSGSRPLAGIGKAYQELQRQRVDRVNCLAVRYDREAKKYEFLEQSMSLDGFSDISSLCSEAELLAS